jgi:HK97 family phage prohead protease
MNMELRVQDAELVANEDGTMTVSGYVNKTDQLSNVLGTTKRFVEKIAKGVFSKAILNAVRDIDFLAEHNSKLILASTRNDSLNLREDEQGLFMEATIAPTSWGKDYYELINSGILRNMSFGFRTVKDSWQSLGNGLFERTIEEMELFEVSVVRDPAYSQSTIASRGIDVVEEVEIPSELEEEIRQMEKIIEMLTALEERVGTLVEEVKELRSQKEQVEEVREDEQVTETAEVVEQTTETVVEEVTETVVEETQAEEVIEEVVEEVSEEKTEDSESSEEIKEEQVEETVVEEDERSQDVTSELAELRSRLASLK